MIFEDYEGQPIPLLPRNGDGTPRVPDGVRFFNLKQASKKFRRHEKWLRGLWRATCEPWLKLDKSPKGVAKPETSAATAPVAAIGEPSPPSVLPPDPLTLTRLDLYHNLRMPELTNEEFELVVEDCRQRGLNILTGDIAASVGVDERGKRKVDVITTIAAFRKIGERNGRERETEPQWCGRDGEWKDVWTLTEPPYMARVGVFRRGLSEPQWGHAYWDLCVQYVMKPTGEIAMDENGPVLTEFWRKGGPFALGKCASAAAHRAAFAELGNLYTFDEMSAGRRNIEGAGSVSARAAGVLTAADPARVDNVDDVLIDDSTPTTEHGFHLELRELNFNKPEAREMLIRQMEMRFPNMRQRNPVRFYALVLHTVRPNPQAYGAEAA